MDSLPDFSILAYLEHPSSRVPASTAYPLNLSNQGALATGDHPNRDWIIENIHGDYFRVPDSDRAAVAAYVAKHYIRNNAFALNPTTLLWVSYEGFDFRLKTIAGVDLVFPGQALDTLPLLIKAGFVPISRNEVISPRRAISFNVTTGKLVFLADPNLVVAGLIPVDKKFRDGVAGAVVYPLEGWTSTSDGTYLDSRHKDILAQATS